MVIGDWHAGINLDRCSSPLRLCDLGDDPLNFFMYLCSHVRVKGANGAAQASGFRHDIVPHTGFELTYGDNYRVLGDVDLAAGDSLQATHNLGTGHDGIHPGPRPCAVGLTAGNLYIKSLCARHHAQ